MGLMSWFQSLRARGQEDRAFTPTSRSSKKTMAHNKREATVQPMPSTPQMSSFDSDFDIKPIKRKTRGRSFSRPKSSHTTTGRRRSWFGGRPDTDDDIPQVPKLVKHGGPYVELPAMPSPPRPATVVPDDTTTRTTPQPPVRRKKSWFANDHRGAVDSSLRGLPPVPVTVDQAAQRATSTLPAAKRKSMGEASIKSRRRSQSRSSFFISSNPDESDSDVPPVPALTRADSTESSHHDSSDNDNSRTARNTVIYNGNGGGSIISTSGNGIHGPKKSRPLSSRSTSSRKSYTPRSAAKGFLHSTTNGAAEDARRSLRKSYHLDNDATLVCLTDEQHDAWAQLMGRGDGGMRKRAHAPVDVLVGRRDGDGDDERERDGGAPLPPTTKRGSFANAEALAALEFGQAR
jgi:hypothetical protein